MEAVLKQKKTVIKAKTWTTLIGIICCVALPQLFHVTGAISGMGTALGAAFLPMHIAVFAVGLMAGPAVGAITGAVSVAVSFALTGMPTAVMLPFMLIELAAYGLVCGLLCKAKMPVILKVLIAQIAGRVVRAVAILLAVYAFGSAAIQVSVIWTSITAGLPGLILQWTLLPLLMYRLKGLQKYYE